MKKTYIVTVEERKDKSEIIGDQSAETNTGSVKIEVEDDTRLNNSKITDSLIERYIFPAMCAGYLILMFVSVLYPQNPLSLFMAFFSFWLVCFYSEWFDVRSHLCVKNKRDHDIWLWAYTVICTIITFSIVIIIFRLPTIPNFIKNNISNWLTWLSIVVFVIDKTWSHQQSLKG